MCVRSCVRVICFLLGLASLVSCHQIDSTSFPDIAPIYESFHESIHARDRISELDTSNDTAHLLYKRDPYAITATDAGAISYLRQAFLDLQTLVAYVATNPNPAVFQRYFGDQPSEPIDRVFQIVFNMSQPGGVQNPFPPGGNLGPTNLGQISLSSTNREAPTLAFSDDVELNDSPNPSITITSFGWGALFRKRMSAIQCSDIGPGTNYKMHFLGSLLLHETLHFHNVGVMAWNRILGIRSVLDDQDGRFPCFGKAYGPFEAIELAARDVRLAKINIENYVWYALETFWAYKCPGSIPANNNGMFTAPTDNDIPTICKQFAKGFAVNIWCWVS